MACQQTTQRATRQHDRFLCLRRCGPFLAVWTGHLIGWSGTGNIRLSDLRLDNAVHCGFFGRNDGAVPPLGRSVCLSLPICRRRGWICLRVDDVVRQPFPACIDHEMTRKQVFMDGNHRLRAAGCSRALEAQVQSGLSGHEWLCS
jgi:hypothetical protein